jgi:hypothetical protein
MSRHRQSKEFGPRDRIVAFAEATEAYAETLDDPDLANVYWGKSLGLWQAAQILIPEQRVTGGRRLRGPGAPCDSRRTDRRPSTAARPVTPAAANGGAGR